MKRLILLFASLFVLTFVAACSNRKARAFPAARSVESLETSIQDALDKSSRIDAPVSGQFLDEDGITWSYEVAAADEGDQVEYVKLSAVVPLDR